MADYFNYSRHDIAITDPVSGDILGFCVARKGGELQYYELDGKSLVDLFSTSPTQISTNPEEELILGQSNFKAGFGKEYYDSNDPKRYFQSFGCDLRHDGGAIAGWGSTSVSSTPTMPTAPTITNADMELT